MAYDDATNMAMITGGMYGPNPYTKYKSGIPPTSYRGTVTDAMGNPIAPPAKPPGTTLNQTQQQPAATAGGQTYGLQPSDLAGPSALNPSGNLAVGMADWGGMMSPQARDLYRNSQFQNPGGGYTNPGLVTSAGGGSTSPAQHASLQASAPPPDTSYQDAIDILSNPGKVTTPGANVPATQPVSTQPSVLDAFLANQKGGGAGAGNYSNAGFFDTLNKLRGNHANGRDEPYDRPAAPESHVRRSVAADLRRSGSATPIPVQRTKPESQRSARGGSWRGGSRGSSPSPTAPGPQPTPPRARLTSPRSTRNCTSRTAPLTRSIAARR